MADGTIVIDTSIDKKKIDSQVSSIRSNVEAGFKNIAKIAGAALATATAAVGAFAVSSVKDFIVFEDKMNEIFTMLPGASTALKNSMTEDVKALSKEMGVLPEDVMPAVYQALSAGISKENVFDFVRTSSKLATAGVAEMDDAVGVLTTIVNNYAKKGLTAEEASNMLFTTVKDGVTSVPELATKLGDVVPIAASLGVGFDEVAGATGAMTAIMGKGSTMKAVTNMRGMLNELGKEGTAADVAFQKVAGVGFAEFIENGGTLQEAMGVLKTASIENNTAINNLFGSIEAGQAALILAGDGAEKFASVLDHMKNSTGATEAAFQTMTESAKFQIDKIKANVEVLKLNFAAQFMPAMNGILMSILGMIDGTEGAVEQFSTLVGGLLSDIVIKAVEFLPKMIAVGSNLIINMTKGILEALPQIAEQLSYMLGYLIGVISVKLPEFLQKGKDFILNIIDGMDENSEELLSNLGTMVSSLVTWLLDNAKDFIVGGAEIIAKIIQGIFENAPLVLAEINKIVASALQWITDNAPDMIQSGIELVTNLAKGILDSIPLIVDEIANIVGTIVSWVTTNAPDMVASGIELIVNLIQGIANSIPAIASKLKEVLSSMISWFADNAPDLIVSGALLVAKLIVGIINAIPTIVTAGIDLIAGLAKALVDSWPTLKEKGKDAVGKLVEGLKDSAKNISSEAIELGKNLIDGFIKGVVDLKDTVVNKVKEVFTDVVGGVKKLLGIKSPSKVFKGIGENVSEGFADGIEDGKKGVMRSAEDIAEIAVDTVEASVPDAKQAGTNLANAVDQGVKDKKPAISTTWKSVLDDMSTNTTTWVDTITGIIGTLKGAFADTMTGIGEAIVTGGLSWDIFAKAGLNALADVLAAIGEQLTAMAVLKLVQQDWLGAAIAGAGATAAFIASGMIKGAAASYDVGGIIDRDQLANIHQGETILPKGITADMKSAGLMIQPLGRNSATSPTMYGIINLDGRELARAVFRHTDSNVGLAYTG